MNVLVENDYIKEVECGSNFSYVLNNNDIFLSTEYKVLQSQNNSCFVKCMKMMYNGKIQLYYFTDNLKPFASMVSALSAKDFLSIVSNLLMDIVDVKHNGFLSCQNIDIAFKHIYIDLDTYKASLVYLPLSERLHKDGVSFERTIRRTLAKLISDHPNLYSPEVLRFSAVLSDESIGIEELFSYIKGEKTYDDENSKNKTIDYSEKRSLSLLHIIAINAPVRTEFIVTTDSFIIGSKAESCDAVISFNRMISRTHCRIDKIGDRYFITDLQSLNGSFLNKVKLQPYQSYPINDGDIIRLANSDFQVSIC